MPELYDYVSPNLRDAPDPFAAFPYARSGPQREVWGRFDPHRHYYDERCPPTGFVNLDEAAILYAYGRKFAGKPALEIGCHVGFSAWHLLKGGARLSICDPCLHDPQMRGYVAEALVGCGNYNLLGMASPDAVYEMGMYARPWKLVFIDGDHTAPRPAVDALAAQHFCAADAAIVFHDALYPGVADAICLLRGLGWNSRLYRTSQVLAVCWRGDVEPVEHTPDPAITMPEWLEDLA